MPQQKKVKSPKYIFVSGGVLSGIGKGVTAATIGLLLKKRGYTISTLKCENYLNYDSGTINPIEHGDPFLCDDGLEADMDLGTYEKFLDQPMGWPNFTTIGQIYKTVIDKERNMEYEGEDVEAVPHVTNEIIRRIKNAQESNDADITIIELGGTVGEYQNALYYEACRIMKALEPENVINVHVTYLPFVKHLGEPKTKPTQLSVRTLMSMGIYPDLLIVRSEVPFDKRRRYLLGLQTSVPGENVIEALDVKSVYEVPLNFEAQDVDKKVLKKLDLPIRKIRMDDWRKFTQDLQKPKKNKIRISIVGKYFSTNKSKEGFILLDAYAALLDAIKHASYKLNLEVDFNYVNAEKLEEDGLTDLKNSDGIIVPIGWGKRGVEGKIKAIKFAREKKIPYLGLCYGMQLACIEYARNVLGMKDANSTEIDKKTAHPIIHDIPLDEKYQTVKGDNVSMRLGAYDCVLKKDSLAFNIYDMHEAFKDKRKRLVRERHRHRYEFNNEYRKAFEDSGFIFSGTSPDDFFVEMIELPKDVHPFFIATQGHPEYKSKPLSPHPMFVEFEKACFAREKIKEKK